MSAYITVLNGTYRSFKIKNQTFALVADYKEGTKGGYITVLADESLGEFAGREVRVKVESMQDIIPANAADCATSVEGNFDAPKRKEPKVQETDEQAIERIRERFDILEEMTEGAVDGTVRAMIVVGPPGVGKSFGVEKVLDKSAMFDKIGGTRPRYEIVKGAMSAIGLYCKLYASWNCPMLPSKYSSSAHPSTHCRNRQTPGRCLHRYNCRACNTNQLHSLHL